METVLTCRHGSGLAPCYHLGIRRLLEALKVLEELPGDSSLEVLMPPSCPAGWGFPLVLPHAPVPPQSRGLTVVIRGLALH